MVFIGPNHKIAGNDFLLVDESALKKGYPNFIRTPGLTMLQLQYLQ
jgi:hypothetical protein